MDQVGRVFQKIAKRHGFCRFCVFVALLCVGSLWIMPVTAENVVEISAFEYPPMMSASLPSDGLLGEIVHAAFQEVGATASIQYTSPHRLLMNKIGTAESGGFLSPISLVTRREAEQDVVCMKPLFDVRMVFYYYKPHHENQELQYTNLEELQMYSVGALRGSNTIEILKTAGITVQESTVEAQIQKLYKARSDLAIIGLLTGKNLVEQLFPDEIDQFAFMEKPLVELPSTVCFNKAHPSAQAWSDMFVEGFTKILQDGTYRAILEKYYGSGQVPVNYESRIHALNEGIILEMP